MNLTKHQSRTKAHLGPPVWLLALPWASQSLCLTKHGFRVLGFRFRVCVLDFRELFRGGREAEFLWRRVCNETMIGWPWGLGCAGGQRLRKECLHPKS